MPFSINSAKIRLDEDVIRRRLQDVFSSSWSRSMYLYWPYVLKMSSGRFQDFFKTSCKNVFKISSRRLQDMLKTSSRSLVKSSLRRIQNVFKTTCKNVFKTSSRGHQDALKTSCRNIYKTFSRHIIKSNCFC